MKNLLENFLKTLKKTNSDLNFVKEENLKLLSDSLEDGIFWETVEEFKKCLEDNEVHYTYITLSDEIASKIMLKSLINAYISNITDNLNVLWKNDSEITDETRELNLSLLKTIGELLYNSNDLDESIEIQKSCRVGDLDTLIVSDKDIHNFVLYADQKQTNLDHFKSTLELIDRAVLKVFAELSEPVEESGMCS